MRMFGVTMTLGNVTKKSEIPILLLLKLIFQVIKKPHNRLRYINGLHKFMREGYQELWNRVAAHHNVQLNTSIKNITRHENYVTVETSDKTHIFDKLLLLAEC
jgi:hypothetical protein